MPKLPVIDGWTAVRALERAGFVQARQKGSHVSMVRHEPFAAVTIPLHEELDRGTLRAIIRGAGLTVEQFIDALNR